MSKPRRAKRFLTAEQKYDLWVRILSGQVSNTAIISDSSAGVI